MSDILSFIFEELFPLIIGLVFLAVFGGVFASVAKKRKQDASSSAAARRETQPSDGSLTQHQRDYINGLRVKQSERKAEQAKKSSAAGISPAFDAGDHTHVSDDEEYYEEIVGSLGEVNDEGCADLSGVRLITHDIAYESEDARRDYADVAKALVLGEIINTPRFKTGCRKK